MSMPQIQVRPAQAEDRDTVLAFCAHTWTWGDYIERVWDIWLNDANGMIFVVTLDGQPVGMTHMLMVSPIDAWLEGLRIDPNFRQRGLVKELNQASITEAIRRGATHVRLTVDSQNTRSIQITESGDPAMHRVGSFTLFSATPLPPASRRDKPEATQLANLEDLDEILHYLNASNIFPMTGGLYNVSFTAIPITAELLEAKIMARQVYLLRRWSRLDGLAIAEPRNDQMGTSLSLGYIDGTTIEAISLIAYDLRCRLSDMQIERLRAFVPDLVLVRDAFMGLEYKWEEMTFYTYERSLT